MYTEYYPLVSWTCFGSQIALLGMLNARRFRCMPLAPLRSLLLLATLAASAASMADARSFIRPLVSESRRDSVFRPCEASLVPYGHVNYTHLQTGLLFG